MGKVLILSVVFAVVTYQNHVTAQQNILEQGMNAAIGAIAKGKEILDHGVNVKSERQQSYDIFGLKFGTNNGVNTGFGDAATEKNLNSVEDDLVRRKKRSLGVLEALRSAGLFTNSAAGTNVNVIKINSVSNVNNYGPETTTTASSRRRRRLIGNHHAPLVYNSMDEKVSYVSSDTELNKDKGFKSHTEGENHASHRDEVEENQVNVSASKNRRGSLVFSKLENKISYFASDSEAKADGSMKTHTLTGSREATLNKISIEPESEGQQRAKRSPQEEMDEGSSTTDLPPRNGTRPGPPDGDGGPPRKGRPRGGPGGGPGGPRGGPRGGPGGGSGGGPRGGPRGGKGRRPPPPSSEEGDEDQTNDDAQQRKKRETAGDEDSNQSNSSYYSDSSSSEENGGQRRRKREVDSKSADENNAGSNSSDSSASSYYSSSSSSEYSDSSSSEYSDSSAASNEGGEDTKSGTDDVNRVKRSPCRAGGRATTTPAPEEQRIKREAESQEDVAERVEKDVSWFSDVMDKFFRVVKKVADSAKQVFSAGKRDGVSEGNSDAERI